MLSELSELQSSDEKTWGCPEISFTIDTRSDDDGEIVERKYTFSYAKEWDQWSFIEFDERRADADARVTAQNWRRTRHVFWDDTESADVSVPPEVTAKLEEVLGLDSMVLQQ